MNILNIITDKLVFGGDCLTKIDGKNVFIPFAIPGEKLEVEITQSRRDYDVAQIVKIEQPSEHRIEPKCPLYKKCGGCNMMHIDEDYQKELRKNILSDAFERNGIKLDKIDVISGNNFNYRCRFQLNNGGLSERASNNIIKITNCPIAEDRINEWLLNVNAENRPDGRCHIFGSDKVVNVSGNESCKIAIAQEEKKQECQKLQKKHKNEKQIKKHYSGTVLSENNIVTVEILGKKISFDVRGFFQSNIKVLEKAIQEVCRGLVGKSVLDMYAGCGTFSVFLCDFFENVTLVEHNRDALVFAEQNLVGKKHESIGLSGAKWVSTEPKTKFDAVVIDPPRSGMEKEVLDYLCKSKIPQIRAVSCDPATQARDIAVLVKAGYKIEKIFLLDFYPNTSHVESLVCLSYYE